VVVNPDAVERAQVVDAFIDLPVDSAEPWRIVDAQALERPVAFWPREARSPASPGPDGRASSSRSSARKRIVTHVMSRYERRGR
jgi:hypothetical protein